MPREYTFKAKEFVCGTCGRIGYGRLLSVVPAGDLGRSPDRQVQVIDDYEVGFTWPPQWEVVHRKQSDTLLSSTEEVTLCENCGEDYRSHMMSAQNAWFQKSH